MPFIRPIVSPSRPTPDRRPCWMRIFDFGVAAAVFVFVASFVLCFAFGSTFLRKSSSYSVVDFAVGWSVVSVLWAYAIAWVGRRLTPYRPRNS